MSKIPKYTREKYFEKKYGSENKEKFAIFIKEHDTLLKQYNLKNPIPIDYINKRLVEVCTIQNPIQIQIDKEEYKSIRDTMLSDTFIAYITFDRQKIDEYLYNETALRLGWITYSE